MAHTYHQIWVHLIWATKNRHPHLTKVVRHKVFQYIYSEAEHKGFPLDTINGIDDHVHCLLSLPPKYAVSSVVKHLKGESSKWINDQELTSEYFEWQAGFSAFSVSKTTVPHVRKYIQKQEVHHQTKSFADEMAGFEQYL